MNHYIPYLKAKKLLEARLGATAEEIAAWVDFGPVMMVKHGRNKDFHAAMQDHLPSFRYWPCLPLEGLAAYSNANELDEPPRFHFDWEVHGNDYLGPLQSCWFRAEDIAAFQPMSRYITGEALRERWQELGDQFDAFIITRIEESALLDFYPTGVETQWSSENCNAPTKESALFLLAHTLAVEAEHGIESPEIQAPPAIEQAQEESAGTDRAALMARHKELTTIKCRNPTATLSKEFGISESWVRTIKREEREKPTSGMGAMVQQLTASKVHKIGK
ncbi:MAG: hypothetical protein COW48_04700 [Hydrogenophilales bacterium CG17_big_fil_post_rev_8_21_14_2_50_63_12]|nr:MAG: hypothetical protein COW48_04700 [Hydrogenophilales bacterium CG17_big_fil_post_rev_8_21_14_2_50_63_12]PIX98175.1 MAG: hypothetical protein COZ24_01665 [Hydrogenophilales bacterium CG_4_10_14_3_um_filter_63_21]PJB03036.1 MAG: hypothetical protein CO126_08825 [Hydrogenophilales bacterium CG_4_9_14_3_um_filter_63_34]